ncbi:porin [Vibrio sp. 10N.237.312.C02]|uniref:porin n=1 Tax=unclassified Vibrio TaxID=2614977 RepID=UPI00352CAAD8
MTVKKTLLSVVITNTLLISAGASAADDRTMSPSDIFFYDALKFGGHVGTSIEVEEKNITDFASWGGGKSKERTTTHEVFNVFYNNAAWNATALYAFKLENRKKKKGDYAETENGYKHLLSLNKSFQLGNGWGTGLIYELEYTKGDIVTSAKVDGLKTTKAEHSIRPYLTYWNNEYSAGFYSNLEYLYNDSDKSVWGSREEEGYSLLFKPYKRFGQWEVAAELYYQVKENKAKTANGSLNEASDFTEMYIEPIVQYSFEEAGTMYVRARIGENETKHTDGWAKNETFFKDIRKATLGYEQAIGDDWLVKGELEWAKDTETFSKLKGEEKTVEQETMYLQALYRF